VSKKNFLPTQQVRADFAPETLNEKNRSVEVVWTTGSKVKRIPWMGEPYMEELSLKSEHVRMDFLNSGKAPALAVHNTWSLGDVIGVVEKAWLTPTEGRAIIRFSEREDVEPIWQDVKNGILKGISVGYNVHKFDRMPNSDSEELPTYLAVDWEPKEISLVPLGADAGAGVRSDDGRGSECELINNIAETGEEVRKMVDKTKDAASVDNTVTDNESVKRESAQQERTRGIEIRKIAKTAKVEEAFAEKLINDGTSLDEARKLIVEEWSKKQSEEGTRTQVRVEAGKLDETETRRNAVEDALLGRMVLEHKVSEAGKPFRMMSLLRIAEELVGPSGRGMAPATLASRALSSSDFPLILGNVAEKALMMAYKIQGQTFRPFVTAGELKNYMPAKRYQVGDAPSLLEVKEGGEYKQGSFGEKAESTQLVDYGRIIAFTRQMLINDDLGAFQRVISNFGSAASRLESKLVYTDTLVANPNMADGDPLFHANHANLAGATVIAETGMTAMVKLIMDQKTLDLADYLNLLPKFLVCGTAKMVEAQKILTALLANKAGDVNPFQNAYQLIVEPRITGNKWFMIASPSDISTIEVARLTGENGPVIDSKEGWSSDGLEVKCRHTVAVKAIEWKGMAYNPGA